MLYSTFGKKDFSIETEKSEQTPFAQIFLFQYWDFYCIILLLSISKMTAQNWTMQNLILKDDLPHLFPDFRNKYFNKISLDKCYFFIINCTSYKKMHGFSINMTWKIRIKCKLPFSSWLVRISILITCVMWLCTGNFLIRARDRDVWINYFCPMRQFRWRSAIG